MGDRTLHGPIPYQDRDSKDRLYQQALAKKAETETHTLTPPQIFCKHYDSVVIIKTRTPVMLNGVATEHRTTGMGFFVKCDHIVTAASILLLDPTAGERIPPAIYPCFARVKEILVQAMGRIYYACLVGLDGANNVAVIKIVNGPKKVHCLPWSSSRNYPTGSPIYLIGDPALTNAGTLEAGVVKQNHLNPPDSRRIYEGLATDLHYKPGQDGSPLLCHKGKVVGIVSRVPSLYLESNPPLAVSEEVAHRIADALIEGPRGRYGAHLQHFEDPYGDFYRYIKGYFGLCYHIYGAFDLTPCSQYNRLRGIVIDGVTNNSPFCSVFVNEKAAIVTHVNGCPVGGIPPQIIPDSIGLHLIPGEAVTLTYRLLQDNYAIVYNNTACLVDYPLKCDNVWTV